MDNSKSRKSDAAATRKRRSSILKSQRAPRAPLSELEFHVTTPQDAAKSRRVSFSRRTGVAEFEISDATTAWKNVYEEHNKSLETSGNESGGAQPRVGRVQHLAGRGAALFQDAEAELVPDGVADEESPRVAPELSPLTERRTADVFRLAVDVTRDAAPTGRLDIDFSAVAPLDDLDALQRDLDAERRGDLSEYDIEVDFNATHFTLKADDSDDMSITDSVRGPRVVAAGGGTPDWTADKENVVVNPYVAPPPADFADDDILVFDGKKCKFQSNLSDEPVKTSDASRRNTIVYDTDISVTQAVAERLALPADDSRGLAVGSETVFFDDVADMTVTRAVPAQILPQKADLQLASEERILPSNETRRRTIVYGNENADISVTQALPANIITPIQIACDDSDVVPERLSKTEKQKTMYFDDMADISVTQTLPANIIQREPERDNERDVSVKRTASLLGQDARTTLPGHEAAQPHTDRRRTIVYGNDDGDLSVTHALPVNILDKDEAKPNVASTARRTTIVYGNDDCDVSITGVVPANIIVDRDPKPAQSENARRRTILYGNDDGNISMTGVAPANIMVNEVEAKRTQPAGTDRRRTIVYGNDDGNISMTGVVPANIMVDREVVLAQSSSTDRRKTIVYGNEDGNVSVTGVVPANIMVDENNTKLDPPITTERRKTIVFGNDDGNLSVTRVVPTNIMVDEEIAKPTIYTTTERRTTVVFGNDDGNVSITGVVPANVIIDEQIKSTEEMKTTDRRRTVVYGNYDGNISVTEVVPANIIVDKGETKLTESVSNERRKTIVYGNDDGEISMTGVVPANMIDKDETNKTQPTNSDRSKTFVYGNNDGDMSTTGVMPAHMVVAEELEDGAKLVQLANTERRRTVVYGDEDADISMTEVVPADIVDDGVDQSQHTKSERRKIVEDGNDVGNISMKGPVPATDLLTEEEEDRADLTQPANERRKTIVYGNDEGNLSMTGVVPANVTADIAGANQSRPILMERRKTIAYEHEGGDISMMGVVIVEEADRATNTERRNTVVNENEDISVTGVVRAPIIVSKKNEDAVETIKENIDHGDEEGDVSMTEVETRSHSLCALQTLPIEPEDTICEDKNDQVSMTAVPRSPSVKSHDDISMQTSAVSRQSLANKSYGNLSICVIDASTFHKSPGKVVVYGASTRGGELGHTQHEDGGSLGAYASQEGDARNVSLDRSVDALCLTSNRVSNIDESHKSDNFEDMCTATIDAFSRRLAATRPSPVDASCESLTNDSISMLDPLSRTRPGRASVLDELSRSLILEEFSTAAARLSRRSPPASVLDALLDMSSMDDELVAGASRADSAATLAPAADADDGDAQTSLEYEKNDGVGDRPRRFSDREDRAVGCEEESPEKEDARVETEDAERDEGNQTQWATSCAGTQADDTRAILDALDRFTDTRRSGDSAPRRSLAPDRRSMLRSRDDLLKDISMAQALMKIETDRSDSSEPEEAEPSPPRPGGEVVRTLRFDDDSALESPGVLRKPTAAEAPARRAAVIPPYLRDVGGIKDLMEELVKPAAEAAPGPAPALHREIQTDRPPSSQIDLAPEAQYRATTRPACGPPGESDKPRPRTPSPLARLPAETAVLMFDPHNPLNNVALPAAAGAPHAYSPRREEGAAACPSACPSPWREECVAACPSACPSPRREECVAACPSACPSPWREECVAACPSACPSPRREEGSSACPSACPSLRLRATQTEAAPCRAVSPRDGVSPAAVFAAYAVKRERASPADIPMDGEESAVPHRSPQRVAFELASPRLDEEEEEEAEPGEARKRGLSPGDPRRQELTPKPAIKVQRISTTPRRLGASPARSGPRALSPDARARSPGGDTVQQLLSEFHLSRPAASPATASPLAARSADDVRADAGADLVNRISMLPFIGTECSWESRSGDTWSFRLLRARLRLVVRLAHGVRPAHAHTDVVRAVVQHAHAHESDDPVARWCVRLAAEALQQLAARTRRAGLLPGTLRAAVALCRRALRWARALHHARSRLACSLDDHGRLALKVANVPLRSVWEVTLRVSLAGGGGEAWPRADDVRVAGVVASWTPRQQDVEALLAPLPRDWGHVPRAVWKIFKYLKNKRLEDDDLMLGY